MTVSRARDQVAVFVGVCVDGKGPYPFLVDTGAASSEIDTRLAARLRLATVGGPEPLHGAGCTTRTVERPVRSWSLAGISLQPQRLLSLPLPQFGGRGEPMGIIGSDVWQRFGQLRVDFRRADIVLPGSEHPPATRTTVIARPSATALPRVLATPRPTAVLPMITAVSPQGVQEAVWVAFGNGPALPFLPDTGSSASAVDKSIATAARLRRVNEVDTQNTQCSVIVEPRAASGPWFIGSRTKARQLKHRQPLPPLLLDELDLGPGWNGLLGSDAMQHFGSVVFDYAGGTLLLGAG